MRYLCTDNKIARAHIIWALRIVQPNGVVMSDNDDDGETAAGGRLMHLLDMMKLKMLYVLLADGMAVFC